MCQKSRQLNQWRAQTFVHALQAQADDSCHDISMTLHTITVPTSSDFAAQFVSWIVIGLITMKPWQTPLNKPSSNGNKGTKRERERGPKTINQKSRTQSGSLRIVGTNHVQNPPTNHKKQLRKRWETWKSSNKAYKSPPHLQQWYVGDFRVVFWTAQLVYSTLLGSNFWKCWFIQKELTRMLGNFDSFKKSSLGC